MGVGALEGDMLFSPTEHERDLANVVNRLHRHCRIGRVTKKMQILGGKWVVMPNASPCVESTDWWKHGCKPIERLSGVWQ